MEIKFRIADIKDVDAIIELCNECFFENTNKEEAKKVFAETKSNPNSIYLIGIIDGKVIAHTRIEIVRTIFTCDMDTFAILNHVCVKDEYRKHKIGTKMLVEVEKICKEHKCNSMKLWSNNFRKPAHACYLKFGFVRNDATFFSKEI